MTANAPLMNVRGFAYRKATSPRTPSADAVQNPKAIEAFTPALTQENLVDNRDADEFLINYASWPGVKSFAAPFGVALHETTHTELAPVFLATFGALSSTAVLTINGAGPHTNGTITMNNGNLPAPIIQIDGDDGKTYIRPVKSFDTGVPKLLTLAIKLPTGVLPTAVRNPAAANGACWQELYNAAVHTFRCEFDRRGQPNERKGYADVCLFTEVSLRMDSINERLRFGLNVAGAEWTLGSAPNVTARAKTDEQFLAYNATCFIGSLGTPAIPVSYQLRGLTMNFAPEYVIQNGTTGVDGDDADPSSNVIDAARNKFMPNGFTLQFSEPDMDRYDNREAMEDEQVFLLFKSRVGGIDTPTRVLAVWFPEATANDNPMAAANGQLEADDQLYSVGQSTLLASATGLLTKCAMAIMEF